MKDCRHQKLHLITAGKKRLRCRKCHLTISSDELDKPYCPECFEIHGKEYSDFEEVEAPEKGGVKYRCEECGIIIDC